MIQFSGSAATAKERLLHFWFPFQRDYYTLLISVAATFDKELRILHARCQTALVDSKSHVFRGFLSASAEHLGIPCTANETAVASRLVRGNRQSTKVLAINLN
jgi:hypothetical protein